MLSTPAASLRTSKVMSGHGSNYSVYSINDGVEERPRGISELGCLVSTPWTHKSFIYERRLISSVSSRRLSREAEPPFLRYADTAVSGFGTCRNRKVGRSCFEEWFGDLQHPPEFRRVRCEHSVAELVERC
jgi:hypothetical protein